YLGHKQIKMMQMKAQGRIAWICNIFRVEIYMFYHYAHTLMLILFFVTSNQY
ncbi:hypothetical protein ACJX0J_011970, partial [Zea mays]